MPGSLKTVKQQLANQELYTIDWARLLMDFYRIKAPLAD